MTAARVLNPNVLSEFCKIRSPVVNRNMPCGHQLNRIKRDLFGPANPIETNKIFVEQLEQHQEKAIKKWSFDFRAGVPLNVSSQFIWERVSFQESTYAPEMYTLTRAAHARPNTATAPNTAMDLLLDERANRENTSNSSITDDTDSCDDSLDESTSEASIASVIFKVPAAVDVAVAGGGRVTTADSTTTTAMLSPRQLLLRKRQPKITEYMKERKRLAQTPKKVSSPPKRMRTNSGSSSSTHANSISSHFTLRSQLPRNN